MDQADIDTILASITPERCTEITCELVNVPSLTGNERPIAETCVRLLKGAGIDAVMQEFEPDRFNCIGRIRGTGGGPTLLFNGHMDISFNGDEQYLPDAPGYRTKALVKDGFIHGMGVHNMKSGVGAFIAAAEAVVVLRALIPQRPAQHGGEHGQRRRAAAPLPRRVFRRSAAGRAARRADHRGLRGGGGPRSGLRAGGRPV
jgi:hypothetical protein